MGKSKTKNDHEKMFCPKCGSSKIIVDDAFSFFGNPIISENVFGYRCMNCDYFGKIVLNKSNNKK